MRSILIDPGHNLFHKLTVIFLKGIFFVLSSLVSVFVISVGYRFSLETIQPIFPAVWLEKITLFTQKIPLSRQTSTLVFNFLGHWYKDSPAWWAIIIGLPLVIFGIDVLLISFFNFLLSASSPIYNRANCPFCKGSVKIVDSEKKGIIKK